jgi:transcriptional regulator with XRE-family HTH domain
MITKKDIGKIIQNFRKQKGLTQEEVANALFVSRTAISKWESGRGYPNIDSLKAIASFFSVTVDELLSGEQLLSLAEKDLKQKGNHLCDLLFGLLDCAVLSLLFIPLFAQKSAQAIQSCSLLSLDSISNYLKIAYFFIVILIALFGLLTLTLQNCNKKIWLKNFFS